VQQYCIYLHNIPLFLTPYAERRHIMQIIFLTGSQRYTHTHTHTHTIALLQSCSYLNVLHLRPQLFSSSYVLNARCRICSTNIFASSSSFYSVSTSVRGRTGSGTSVDELEQCSWASQLKSKEGGEWKVMSGS